jgi:hypothetical protein
VLHRRLCDAQNELYARGRQSQGDFAVRRLVTGLYRRNKLISSQIDNHQISNLLEIFSRIALALQRNEERL